MANKYNRGIFKSYQHKLAASKKEDTLPFNVMVSTKGDTQTQNYQKLCNTDSDIMITIGMIVKNEEKHLRSCLEALQPLRDAVSCELIITDTGSTDNTVAIAEEFGAEVRHFTWCDDFGAARNTTLKGIRGQWFLYIDADEYFDRDLSALIVLFITGAHEKYRTIGFVERNYKDVEHSRYSEFVAFRMHRVYQGMCFAQKIHEYLPVIEPFYRVSTVLHHDGYIEFGKTQGLEKQQRNLKLIQQELSKKPNNLHVLNQITDILRAADPQERQQKVAYLDRAFQIEPKTKTDFLEMAMVVKKICIFCYGSEEYEKAITVYRSYLQRRNREHLQDLDIYYVMAGICRNAGESALAGETTHDYLRIYDAWRAGEFAQSEDLFLTSISYSTIQNFYAACIEQADYDCKHQNFAQAKEWMTRLSAEQCAQFDELKAYTWLTATIAVAEQDADTIVKLYQEVCKIDDEEAIAVLKNIVENAQDGAEIYAAMGAVESDDPYILLCRLRSAEQNESAYTLLERLQKQTDLLSQAEYADILYYTIQMNYGVEALMQQLTLQEMESQVAHLCAKHATFTQVVLHWVLSIQSDRLQIVQLGRITRFIEAVIFYAYRDTVVPTGGTELFEQLAAAAYLLAKRLYQPSILSEENLPILPPLHAMAYYAAKAIQARDARDLAAYAHYLRETARVHPSMQKPIAQLAAQLQEELAPQQDPQKEFEALASQVRIQTAQLIRDGHLQEAEQVLEQYTKVNPKDKDAIQMYEALQRTRTAHKTAE